MQQPVHSDPNLGDAPSGWQPDRDEDYGDEVRRIASSTTSQATPLLPPSALDPAQNVLIEQSPGRAASVPTRQALPIVPPDAYEAIPPAPPEINRPETLIELGPFRTATSLPTLQAPLTLPPIHEASLPESQTVSWWGVIGRVLAFMLTLALLTFLFKRIWLLWALVWAASILGLISWHRQRHPKYGPIGGILEFNYEIVLGVLWLLGNFILAFIGFV